MKRLIKHMSIYGLGGILSKCVNFLLLPLYTRVLSPADYGELELIYTLGYIITILYGLMIGSGYIRYYFDSSDEINRQIYFGSSFWFTFFCAVVFTVTIFIFADNVAPLLFKFENGALYLKLISSVTIINSLKTIFYNHLQISERPISYISIHLIAVVLSLSFTIFLVGYLKWGVQGVLYAQLCGFSIEFLILASMLFRSSLCRFSLSSVKQMLIYSIPLIPIQVSAFMINLSDRYFLQAFRSLDEVGLYALGYKFASIIPLFAIQPLRAFTPHIFSLIDKPDVCKQTLADFTRYYLAGLLFVVLTISLFSREVILMISESRFHGSWSVVFMLCMSFVFYGLLNMCSYAIEIVKKNWISGLFWSLAAVISVSLNFLFVPRLGIYGSALASIISYACITLCYFGAVAIVYPVPYSYKKMAFIIMLTACIYGISLFVPNDIVISVMIKVGLLILYLGVIYYGGYFSLSEKAIFSTRWVSLLRLNAKSASPS